MHQIQCIQCSLGQVSGQETNDTVGIYMEVWVSPEYIKKITTAEILFSAFNIIICIITFPFFVSWFAVLKWKIGNM